MTVSLGIWYDMLCCQTRCCHRRGQRGRGQHQVDRLAPPQARKLDRPRGGGGEERRVDPADQSQVSPSSPSPSAQVWQGDLVPVEGDRRPVLQPAPSSRSWAGGEKDLLWILRQKRWRTEVTCGRDRRRRRSGGFWDSEASLDPQPGRGSCSAATLPSLRGGGGSELGPCASLWIAFHQFGTIWFDLKIQDCSLWLVCCLHIFDITIALIILPT